MPAGSGGRDGWDIVALHRTLLQASEQPGDAPVGLARLLGELDAAGAAGLVTAEQQHAGLVRFVFAPFPAADAG